MSVIMNPNEPTFPEYEVRRYEQAARQFCVLSRINADESLQDGNGFFYPAWMGVAREMLKNQLMLDCMRMYGHGITV